MVDNLNCQLRIKSLTKALRKMFKALISINDFRFLLIIALVLGVNFRSSIESERFIIISLSLLKNPFA